MITYGIILDQSALNKAFDRLGTANMQRILRPPMEASLLSLHDDLVAYPPKSSGKMVWKSLKQRRYFFWALREGKIQVPYQRGGEKSQKLGQSWTWKIDTTMRGLRGEVGASATYAKWVQHAPTQARIHRGNWMTDSRALEHRRTEIVQRFRRAIAAALAAGPRGG